MAPVLLRMAAVLQLNTAAAASLLQSAAAAAAVHPRLRRLCINRERFVVV